MNNQNLNIMKTLKYNIGIAIAMFIVFALFSLLFEITINKGLVNLQWYHIYLVYAVIVFFITFFSLKLLKNKVTKKSTILTIAITLLVFLLALSPNSRQAVLMSVVFIAFMGVSVSMAVLLYQKFLLQKSKNI